MIETARLVLRPPTPDDLPWLLDAMNTAAVLRHLGGAVRSVEQVAQGLADDLAAFADRRWRRWTVWRRERGERIGRIGLFRVRGEAAPAALRGQSEIGWMLAEAHWGQGYASEAARGALAFGFGELALPAVYGQTSDSNAASTRMMARLGFTRTPELDYVDPDYPPADNPTTVYRLDRTEWGERQ